jgi:two-component system phosphate regulon response regulator PhoB
MIFEKTESNRSGTLMARETILIVDDEEDIIELIKYNLKTEGYVILTAGTGEQAIKTARQSLPDLIVLDLMLPGIDGLEVTRYLKKNDQTADIPIVMVTAKGEESDVVTGLELGANDYISKPFSPRELVARIRAILRRRRKTGENETPSGIRQIGDMVIDRARHAVTIQGEPLDLTLSEFELLSFLADKKGWVFTRGQIMDAIHGENYAVTERSIDVIIVGLRKKLKTHAACIETVRGVGYRFKESL